jgi:hypothetical protein
MAIRNEVVIDNLLQLHEHIEIYYSVDGYVAEFTVQDGGKVMDRASERRNP